MSLWKIAWRSIRQRTLASGLTAFSMGMGVALVVTVLVIHGVINQSFRRGAQGYDLIIGAKGSPLQLVLNTVFHLSQPLENIPYSYYQEFIEGRFAPAVEAAIPICTGHDYKGYPAVATIPEYFEKLTYLEDKKYRFAEGKNFEEENYWDAVIGDVVARRTGLKLGSTFSPVAQAVETGEKHHHHDFKVVGILEHTGTPNDRAIFMNIEGFWREPAHLQGTPSGVAFLSGKSGGTSEKTAKDHTPEQDAHAQDAHDNDGHDRDAHEPINKEISAILVCTQTHKQILAMDLESVVNKEHVAQAVFPSLEIAKLFDSIIGNIQLLLLVLAVLVVIVAGIGIMVSMYNSMSDRRHDIAIMRALGASRYTVMSIILMESILLSLGGGALGLLIGHGLVGALGTTIADQTGVIVKVWDFQTVELILIPGLIALATLVGYLPAMYAYKTDVVKSLMAGT
jgi:putative ABC transport system permease protein